MNEGELSWIVCQICDMHTLSRKDEIKEYYKAKKIQGVYFPDYNIKAYYEHKECIYLDGKLNISIRSRKKKFIRLIVMFGTRTSFDGK